MNGTITALRPKGFGFIRDEEGRDRFFNARELVGVKFSELREGLKVEFEPYEQESSANNGLRARAIRIVG